MSIIYRVIHHARGWREPAPNKLRRKTDIHTVKFRTIQNLERTSNQMELGERKGIGFVP